MLSQLCWPADLAQPATSFVRYLMPCMEDRSSSSGCNQSACSFMTTTTGCILGLQLPVRAEATTAGGSARSGQSSPDSYGHVHDIIKVPADPCVLGEAILAGYEVERTGRPVGDIQNILHRTQCAETVAV